MASLVQLVRDLWRAHEAGGIDAFFAAAGDDVVWQPYLTEGRVFHGTAELRETLAAARCVRAFGTSPSSTTSSNTATWCWRTASCACRATAASRRRRVHWAYHFRAGQLWRQTTHASRDEALEALAALRVVSDSTFTLAEDAGADGEHVIRLRGELDIDTVPDLERAVLRERPRGAARGARPQ